MYLQVNTAGQYDPGNQMNQYNIQQNYGQQQFLSDGIIDAQTPPSSTSIRRNSRILNSRDKPEIIGQSLNDRYN